MGPWCVASPRSVWKAASGLRVPVAIGDYLMLQAVRDSGGTALAVTDDEMLVAMRELASVEGVFAAPEATVAALPELIDRGAVTPKDSVLLLLTGAGMKYTNLVPVSLPLVDTERPGETIV
ncbi:MAG: pyridoxal-phosphate dependent enzyme [bacterium]|nr:pyridoxal-phosphate dependent enzyme [bacterium]